MKSKLQVLVSTVNAQVEKTASRMNLETDAIVVNQCDRNAYMEYSYNDKLIKCYFMAERGVGLSRNTALLHSDHEYCLFSDEDIVFDPGYERIVCNAFQKNPDADLITFNFKVHPERKTYYNQEKKRIRWYNYGRYPTFAVAARTESLRRANVSFSLLFGGGARYSNGEDSLFLHDCLKKGLHLYADTGELGQETYRESTWFKGYTDKFFIDRGVLYHYLYGGMAEIFSLRFLYAHKKEMLKEISVNKAYKLMKQGIREGKKRY